VSNGCAPHPVCCARQFFPCLTDCDCCGDNVCRNGVCGPLGGPPDGGDECSETGEACDVTDDCCFEEDICDANGCGPGTVCCGTAGAECNPGSQGCDCCSQLECGSVAPNCQPDGETQCCVPAEGQCADTCECCTPLQCDPLNNQCVSPTCLPTQAACLPGGSGQVANSSEALDCCEPYICSTVVCDGRTLPAACCFPSGYGPCTDDCDCCGTLRCLAGECTSAT
jgi:hypothetical protein